MIRKLALWGALAALVIAPMAVFAKDKDDDDCGDDRRAPRSCRPDDDRGRARNVIFFVGDGMGVSTVSATRVFSVGVNGNLVMDQMPYTALSRTASADFITPDSAPTMTAMMTGHNTNNGVLGLDAKTEYADFNADGDGQVLVTVLEQAKQAGMRVGVVSTARITHATPAACYAHINNRDNENAIALQALPTDASYNTRLGRGVDVLFGGGRQFFVPAGTADEEGGGGSRADLRDLRGEYQAAGYSYVWNSAGFAALTPASLPVLGLFERSHMEYEYDRPTDLGGEPSLAEMTTKAISLLSHRNKKGYFLMVEAGRIDHAHHAGNAFRALTDTEQLDRAIGAALAKVDTDDTLVVVSADHSHVFNIAGYPMRASSELPYTPKGAIPASYAGAPHGGILNTVFDIGPTGVITESKDDDGIPYTALVYGNGPGGRRRAVRVNPATDSFPGLNGVVPAGSNDPAYLQEAAVPLRGSETHAGEEVAIYAIGPSAGRFRGTVKNAFIAKVMREALGL